MYFNINTGTSAVRSTLPQLSPLWWQVAHRRIRPRSAAFRRNRRVNDPHRSGSILARSCVFNANNAAFQRVERIAFSRGVIAGAHSFYSFSTSFTRSLFLFHCAQRFEPCRFDAEFSHQSIHPERERLRRRFTSGLVNSKGKQNEKKNTHYDNNNNSCNHM